MNEIKTKLLEMQKAIMEAIEQDRNKSASAMTHDIGDSIDLATEERDREFYQLLSERDRIKLQQIKHALERIDNDEYGECEECGTPIGKARLMALPFTQLCVDCKSEEERVKGRETPIDLTTPSRIPNLDADDF